MKLYRWIPALALGLTLGALPAGAAKLGDPAPKLKVASWVKGKPVKLAEGKGKKVYVIEFWATWCPPCRTSIPHLTKLQKEYAEKGVVFIGISTEEKDQVEPFVKRMGKKMDYRVAVDDNWATAKKYMGGFKVNSIPHAFVVDKNGKIIWHGHPAGRELEKTIKQALAASPAK